MRNSAYTYYGRICDNKEEADEFAAKVDSLPDSQFYYFGDYDEKDGLEGFCVVFRNRSVTIGNIEDNQPEGHCYVIYDGQLRYDGEFKNGQRHGHGMLYENGTLVYDGEYDHDNEVDGTVYDEMGRSRHINSDISSLEGLSGKLEKYKWDLGLDLYDDMNFQVEEFVAHKIKNYIWFGVFIIAVGFFLLIASCSTGQSLFVAYLLLFISWPLSLHRAYASGNFPWLRYFILIGVVIYFQSLHMRWAILSLILAIACLRSS